MLLQEVESPFWLPQTRSGVKTTSSRNEAPDPGQGQPGNMFCRVLIHIGMQTLWSPDAATHSYTVEKKDRVKRMKRSSNCSLYAGYF